MPAQNSSTSYLISIHAQADALAATLEQYKDMQQAAGPARDAAMLAAYKGFLQLVTAEEAAAGAHPMVSQGVSVLV